MFENIIKIAGAMDEYEQVYFGFLFVAFIALIVKYACIAVFGEPFIPFTEDYDKESNNERNN